MRNVHLIVAPSKWEEQGKLRYRRHRLANHLKKQPATEEVMWIYSASATPKNISSYWQVVSEVKQGITKLSNGILQLGIMDLIPGRLMKYLNFLQSWSAFKLKKELNKLEADKIFLWYTHPSFPFIAKLMDWEAVMYDVSDLWHEEIRGNSNFVSSVSKAALQKAEEDILQISDVVFATSEYIKSQMRAKGSCEIIVVENGVEFENFKTAPPVENNELEAISRPRLGFVGGMKTKVDYALLKKLAKNRPNWSIILVGPKASGISEEFNELINYNNVYWLGGVRPDEVPGYLKKIDVGLIPYKKIEYNKAVFPLKLYEYLAVGLPVVGTGIPSTKKYVKNKVYMYSDNNIEQFIAMCEEAINCSQDQKAKRQRINIARKADWERKFKFMLKTAVDKG